VHTSEDGEWETGDVIKLKPSTKRRKTLEMAAKPVLPRREVATEQPLEYPIESPLITAELKAPPAEDTTAKEPETEFETSREEGFTTGPHGTPTHWKQAVFLLKAPIELSRGALCTKLLLLKITEWLCRYGDTGDILLSQER
jgi:protein arginine N-methyltransferase 3